MTFFAADLGANIAEGFQNMVVGLGVVFAVLIFLMLVISAFKFVNKLDKPKEQPKAAAPAPVAAAPAPAVPAGPGTMANTSVSIEDEVEGPVAAAILAAVAECCGGNFVVKSIKKSK